MKQILSLFLCFTMAFGLFILPASADAVTAVDGIAELEFEPEPTETETPVETEESQESEASEESQESEASEEAEAPAESEESQESIAEEALSPSEDPAASPPVLDGTTPSPADPVTSGTLSSTEIAWSLDTETGVLSLTGSGILPDYNTTDTTPWYTNRDSIVSVVIGEGISHIGDSAFAHLEKLTAVTLPESLLSLGDSAFAHCTALATCELPKALETIGAHAFASTALTALTLPDGLKSIGENAFTGLTSITEITLPGTLTTIGSDLFGTCGTLKTVTLSEGITHLSDAFINCYAIETLNLPYSINTLDHDFIASLGNESKLKTINVSGYGFYEFSHWLDEDEQTITSEQLLSGTEYTGDLTAVFYKAWDEPFSDVDKDHWFYDNALYCYTNNLMDGMTETTFSPYASATRAQVVTVLYRMAGSPDITAASPFSDVQETDWYHDAVVWASTQEIAQGYETGLFRPNRTVTRQEFLVFLFRYADSCGIILNDWSTYDFVLEDFADGDKIADWAMAAECWSIAQNLQTGEAVSGKYYLNPSNSIRRAELAAFLSRYITGLDGIKNLEFLQSLLGMTFEEATEALGEPDRTVSQNGYDYHLYSETNFVLVTKNGIVVYWYFQD